MTTLLCDTHTNTHSASIDPIMYIQQTHRVRRAADTAPQPHEAPNSSSRRAMSPLGISIGGASFSVKNFLRRKKGNTNATNSNSSIEPPSRPLAMQSFVIVKGDAGTDLSGSTSSVNTYGDADTPADAYWYPPYSYPSYPSPLLLPSQCQSPMPEASSPMMSSTNLSPSLDTTLVHNSKTTMTPMAAATPAPPTSFTQVMKAHFTRDRSRSRSRSISASDSSSPSTHLTPSSSNSASSRKSRKCQHRAVVLVDADFANCYNTDPADWTWSNTNSASETVPSTSNNYNSINNNETTAATIRKKLNRRSLSADCLPNVAQDQSQGQAKQCTRGVARADTISAHMYARQARNDQRNTATKPRMDLVSDPEEVHEQDMDVGNCSMSSGEVLAWMPEATDMLDMALDNPPDMVDASFAKSRRKIEDEEIKKQRSSYRHSVALLLAEMQHQNTKGLSRSDSNSSNVSCSTTVSSDDASTVVHDKELLDKELQEMRKNKIKRRDTTAAKNTDTQEPSSTSLALEDGQGRHSQLLTCGDNVYIVSSSSSPTHFYDSPQVREALRLFLTNNGPNFEEMIDNGFPSEVLISSNGDADDDEYEFEDSDPAPEHCHYLTLRITMTPWHARADETELYGPEIDSNGPQGPESMIRELFARTQGIEELEGNPSIQASIKPLVPSMVPTDAFNRSDSAFSSATMALDDRSLSSTPRTTESRSVSSSVSSSRNSSRNGSLRWESKAGTKPLPVSIVTSGKQIGRGNETPSPSSSSMSSSLVSSSSSTPATSPCTSPPISPSTGPHRKRPSSAVFYFPAISSATETESFDDQESEASPRPVNSLPRPLLPRMLSDQSGTLKNSDIPAPRHMYTTQPQSTPTRRSRRYPYHIHIQQERSSDEDVPCLTGSRSQSVNVRPSSSNSNESEIEIFECYHISAIDNLYKPGGFEQEPKLTRSHTSVKPQQVQFNKPVIFSLSKQDTRSVQARARHGGDSRQTDNIATSMPPPISAKSLRRREGARRQAAVPTTEASPSPPSSGRSQLSHSSTEDCMFDVPESTADLSWEVYSIYSKGRGNQDRCPIIYGHEEIAAHTDGCWRPVPCRISPALRMYSFP
ncbi:hypothetical protein BGX28_007816 [Mortierella sp. GBA30]|nr:hypothetical protein BGX28_007816 [Mortierella sp. GBA30]